MFVVEVVLELYEMPLLFCCVILSIYVDVLVFLDQYNQIDASIDVSSRVVLALLLLIDFLLLACWRWRQLVMA